MPPIQNQRWNACVAWTFAYTMLSAAEARRQQNAEEPGAPRVATDMTDPRNWFSPDFLYSQRDTLDERMQTAPDEPLCFEPDRSDVGGFELGCMRPEKALRLLMERGACTWDWMCEDVATRQYGSCEPTEKVPETGALPDALDQANLRSRRAWQPSSPGAEWFKPDCYVRFGALDSPEEFPLVELRSWLRDEGTPIGIVVQMHEGWMTYGGENQRDVMIRECFPCDITERRGVCLEATGRDLGSQHMMAIVGYDDNFPNPDLYPGLPPEKRGSFLIMNQFGTKWGDEGFMWLPYAELRKIWIAGYGIVAGEPGEDLDFDGVARTACDALGANCDNEGEACVQNDLTGDWDNLDQGVDENDVPQVLGGGGALVPNPAADVLVSGGFGGGTLGPENTGDWYTFEVTDPSTSVLVFVSKAAGDSIGLKLVDANQRRLGTSELDPAGVTETITRVVCDPGTYYVKAFTYGAAPFGVYGLGLTLSPAPAGDDDVCVATSIPLTDGPLPTFPPPFGGITIKPGIGGQVGGTVGAMDEATERRDVCDWYAVQLPEDAAVDITLAATRFVEFDAWRGTSPDTAEYVGGSGRPLGAWLHSYLSLPPRAGTHLFVRVYLVEEEEDGPLVGGGIDDVGPASHGYTLRVVSRGSDADDSTPGGARRLEFTDVAGEPGCYRAEVIDEVDVTDPIDFYRVVAPVGSVVRVRLETEGPLCVSSLMSRPPLRDAACSRAIPFQGRDPEFEIRVEGEGPCEQIMLSVSPEALWQSLELVRGGAYILHVEICVPDEDAGQLNLQAPTEGPVPLLGDTARRYGLVGGADAVDLFPIEDASRDAPFTLWLTDTCRALELEVYDADRDTVIPARVERTVQGGFRRTYDPPGAANLWVRVRSPDGEVSRYTLWLTERAAGPLMAKQEGGDDQPQTARQDLAFGAQGMDSVHENDARDYWRVQVPGAAGTTVRFGIALQVPDMSTHMRLSAWSARGHLLGTTTSLRGAAVRLDVEAGAGTSILVLVDTSIGDGSLEPYTLQVGGTN